MSLTRSRPEYEAATDGQEPYAVSAPHFADFHLAVVCSISETHCESSHFHRDSSDDLDNHARKMLPATSI